MSCSDPAGEFDTAPTVRLKTSYAARPPQACAVITIKPFLLPTLQPPGVCSWTRLRVWLELALNKAGQWQKLLTHGCFIDWTNEPLGSRLRSPDGNTLGPDVIWLNGIRGPSEMVIPLSRWSPSFSCPSQSGFIWMHLLSFLPASQSWKSGGGGG